MCEQIRYVLWGLITYHELEKQKGKQREKTVNAYLIKNSKGRGALSQAVGRIGRSMMSQSILCNYFKVCAKFMLEGAE